MKKVMYQLHAYGDYHRYFGGQCIQSKKIFNDRNKAENYIPEFKDRCTKLEEINGDLITPNLKFNTIKVFIKELEVDDD